MTSETTAEDNTDTTLYIVECDECGHVTFENTHGTYERDSFGSAIHAAYYAGHHDASEHADAERQHASPRAISEKGDGPESP